MDPVDTKTKLGIMARLRNSKGFSLVEMAIVLVIIGIIIAAILKGQDLITNSRAKQLTTAINTWKADVYGYADRNGRFPGDYGAAGTAALNKNGIIGDDATEQAVGATAIAEIVPTMAAAPANPVMVGGQSYYIYIGSVPATVGVRNAMVICPSVDCSVALTPDDAEILKTVDTALDGAADGGVGQLRAISTAPTAATHLVSGLAAVVGRANGVVITATTPVVTPTGTALAWGVTQFGAIYVFDKPY